jgi:hypothetical protein
MSKLIGVTGFARSGKDTFFKLSSDYLKSFDRSSVRYAFADVLKSECDPLTLKYSGISCFTSNDREKNLIRPLLVAYGTHLRREINPDCWIDRIRENVRSSIANGDYVFITDVRFKNEVDWVISEGGLIVNIVRDGVHPANPDEAEQSKLIEPLIHATLNWPTFGEDSLSCGEGVAITTLNQILMDSPDNAKIFQRVASS